MKNTATSALASTLIALALSTSTAFAQDRDRDRTRDPLDPDRVTEQDRVQDRDQDRIADRDRLLDRDQDRLQDRDQDRDRLRDPLHVEDREQLRDRDIYGSEFMTREERREYRTRMAQMDTVQQWARFRAEHQNRMMARARERNAELPTPLYGQQLMTDQERERLRERLQNAETEQERERIRAEHRVEMQARAREHQIPTSELGE
jgi:hypothetical protein